MPNFASKKENIQIDDHNKHKWIINSDNDLRVMKLRQADRLELKFSSKLLFCCFFYEMAEIRK
jgi:hypothetical protein